MKKAQIITNRRVRKNNNGVNCFLMRTISTISEDENGNRLYITRTDYADKILVDEVKLDADGAPIENANGDFETIQVERLVKLGKVDDESKFTVLNNQTNPMFSQIKSSINIQDLLITNNNLFEFEINLKSMMLLGDTKKQASEGKFYETNAEDWELLVEDI